MSITTMTATIIAMPASSRSPSRTRFRMRDKIMPSPVRVVVDTTDVNERLDHDARGIGPHLHAQRDADLVDAAEPREGSEHARRQGGAVAVVVREHRL